MNLFQPVKCLWKSHLKHRSTGRGLVKRTVSKSCYKMLPRLAGLTRWENRPPPARSNSQMLRAAAMRAMEITKSCAESETVTRQTENVRMVKDIESSEQFTNVVRFWIVMT